MTNRGCWTCKKRKILCDRSVPKCSNCIRTRRDCRGYELRLSWPRKNDKKRTIVSALESGSHKAYQGPVRLVNTSSWDIELHDYLTSDQITHYRVPSRPTIHRSVGWSPHKLNSSQNDLIAYFSSIAVNSLAIFGQDTAPLRDTTLRMALSENCSSARAVLQALLAFASQHRYGTQPQSNELAVSALRSLMDAVTSAVGKYEASRHALAGMLLCSWNILNASAAVTQWVWYVCGAKRVATANCNDQRSRLSDIETVVRWLYYHDVMAKFSLRHWNKFESFFNAFVEDFRMHVPVCYPTKLLPPESSEFGIMRLLNKVFSTIVDSKHPSYHSDEYRDHVSRLKSKIENLQINPVQRETHSTGRNTAEIITLYKLATLIYLERASTNFSGQSEEIDRWTDEAIALFSRLESFDQPFPLLIVGSEVRSDERRSVILDLICRTEQRPASRSLELVSKVVQSVWTQDDLAAERLDYIGKLDAILSSWEYVPSIA